ncbi:hypothetical protein KIPB_004561 [Kipferlia bialata]|uniref:Uncharacterized protein n=1 Tax=Kipferlia bialata TaxID=797122 RepID=A0A9K3CTY8_9EUKA|nr:hypothetical protein KIPB_004561 [Kipferlia bialata]|eukprot:g4561.t1
MDPFLTAVVALGARRRLDLIDQTCRRELKRSQCDTEAVRVISAVSLALQGRTADSIRLLEDLSNRQVYNCAVLHSQLYAHSLCAMPNQDALSILADSSKSEVPVAQTEDILLTVVVALLCNKYKEAAWLAETAYDQDPDHALCSALYATVLLCDTQTAMEGAYMLGFDIEARDDDPRKEQTYSPEGMTRLLTGMADSPSLAPAMAFYALSRVPVSIPCPSGSDHGESATVDMVQLALSGARALYPSLFESSGILGPVIQAPSLLLPLSSPPPQASLSASSGTEAERAEMAVLAMMYDAKSDPTLTTSLGSPLSLALSHCKADHLESVCTLSIQVLRACPTLELAESLLSVCTGVLGGIGQDRERERERARDMPTRSLECVAELAVCCAVLKDTLKATPRGAPPSKAARDITKVLALQKCSENLSQTREIDSEDTDLESDIPGTGVKRTVPCLHGSTLFHLPTAQALAEPSNMDRLCVDHLSSGEQMPLTLAIGIALGGLYTGRVSQSAAKCVRGEMLRLHPDTLNGGGLDMVSEACLLACLLALEACQTGVVGGSDASLSALSLSPFLAPGLHIKDIDSLCLYPLLCHLLEPRHPSPPHTMLKGIVALLGVLSTPCALPPFRTLLADALLRSGDNKRFSALLGVGEEGEREGRLSADELVLLASLQLRMGRIETCQQYLDAASLASGSVVQSIRYNAILAEAAQSQGKYTAVVTALQAVLDDTALGDDSRLGILVRLASAKAKSGDKDGIDTLLRLERGGQAQGEDKGQVLLALSRVGLFLLDNAAGDLKPLLETYRISVEAFVIPRLKAITPDMTRSYSGSITMLADVYLHRLHDERAAARVFAQLVQRNPTPGNLIHLGDACMCIGRPRQALKVFTRAMHLLAPGTMEGEGAEGDVLDVGLYTALSHKMCDCVKRQHRYDDALEQLKRTSTTLETLGRHSEAKELADTAIASLHQRTGLRLPPAVPDLSSLTIELLEAATQLYLVQFRCTILMHNNATSPESLVSIQHAVHYMEQGVLPFCRAVDTRGSSIRRRQTYLGDLYFTLSTWYLKKAGLEYSYVPETHSPEAESLFDRLAALDEVRGGDAVKTRDRRISIETAVETLSKGLARTPNHLPLMARLAVTLHVGGQADQAYSLCKDVLALSPNLGSALGVLVDLDLKAGHNNRAAEHLGKLVSNRDQGAKRGGRSVSSHLSDVETLYALLRKTGSLHRFEQYMDLDAAPSYLGGVLGDYCYATCQPRRAVEFYRQASQCQALRAKDRALVMFRLGVVYLNPMCDPLFGASSSVLSAKTQSVTALQAITSKLRKSKSDMLSLAAIDEGEGGVDALRVDALDLRHSNLDACDGVILDMKTQHASRAMPYIQVLECFRTVAEYRYCKDRITYHESNKADKAERQSWQRQKDTAKAQLTSHQQTLQALLDRSTDSFVSRSFVPALTALGILLFNLKKAPQARSMLKRSVKAVPGSQDAMFCLFLQPELCLGTIYLLANKLNSAEEHIKNVIKTDAGNWRSHELLGVIYEREMSYDDASNHYRVAKHLSGGRLISACYRLGFNLLKSGAYRQAISEVSHMLQDRTLQPDMRDNIRETILFPAYKLMERE